MAISLNNNKPITGKLFHMNAFQDPRIVGKPWVFSYRVAYHDRELEILSTNDVGYYMKFPSYIVYLKPIYEVFSSYNELYGGGVVRKND